MLHAASLIHASGCFVMPYWLRGGTAAILPGFTPASYLEAIERWRPARAQPRPDHAADAVPDAGHRRRRPLVGRDDRLRRLADAAAGARAGARSLGPGLRPILRPDRSAARHLRISTRPRIMSAPRPERLLSCGRPSVECEIRLVDEDGNDVPQARPARSSLRAPFAMKGYTDDRSSTRRRLPARRLAPHPRRRPLRRGGLSLLWSTAPRT